MRCTITRRPPSPTCSWWNWNRSIAPALLQPGRLPGQPEELEGRPSESFRHAIDNRRHAVGRAARAGHRADPRRTRRRKRCSRSRSTCSCFPDHEQALFGKAVALQQTGRHAEAVEHYRKVLARNPRCEEALSNLVAMFLEKKDPESRAPLRRDAGANCSRNRRWRWRRWPPWRSPTAIT